MLSSQILLFSGEFDRDLAQDLGQKLMQALWDAKLHDRHTALAVLTLIGCGNAFLKQVIVNFFAKESHRKVVADHNIDVILLLLLVKFIEKSTTKNDEKLLWLSELSILWGIFEPKNRSELYGWLHRVVRDCAGKQHSTPLHRLKNGETQAEFITPELLNKILHSSRQLQSILSSIYRHWLRTDSEGYREYETIQQEIKENTKRIVEQLTQLLKGIVGTTGKTANESLENARSFSEKLLNAAEKIHDGVFAPIGISRLKNETENSDSLLLEKLQNMHPEGDDKKIVWYKPSPRERQNQLKELDKKEMIEVYIPWDASLVTAIQDILTNVRHACSEIENPWNPIDESRAHLWGRLCLKRTEVIIELCNAANNPQEDSEKFNESQTFIRAQLRDSGCSATCKPYKEGKLLTCINIPYAHALHAKTEESKNA